MIHVVLKSEILSSKYDHSWSLEMHLRCMLTRCKQKFVSADQITQTHTSREITTSLAGNFMMSKTAFLRQIFCFS